MGREIFGYTRVSTKEQHLERGIQEIITFCDEHDLKIDVDRNIKKETNWLNQVIKDIPKLDQVNEEKRKPTLKEVLERGKKRQSELTSKEHNKSRTLK